LVPECDEWQYYLEGKARMTVFDSGGKARTFNFQAGDVGYLPFAMGHYIQNIQSQLGAPPGSSSVAFSVLLTTMIRSSIPEFESQAEVVQCGW
jgi:hypothetical protein